MGALCCKPSSKNDNFSSPGRVVGAAPQPPPNAATTSKPPPPTAPKSKAQPSSSSDIEARRKAAEAAEARAKAASQSSKQGKLGGQLAEQKKQTRSDTLNQVSEENRKARDMDANTAVMNYN